MRIIDNFLPPDEFEAISALMLGNDFPWFMSKTKVGSHNPDNVFNSQFTHNIYDNYVPRSELWQTLDPIIHRLNAIAWVRIKANATTATETPYLYGMHVDIDDFTGTTGVFYLNSNNGDTVFADGTRVSAVANRMVLFDAQTPHSGESCTDAKFRGVINFNFYPNKSMVEERFWKEKTL